jgi:hypothetical protein
MNDYYVYVYIDPRNYEEFYYGKGKGTRKDAHLSDTGDSAKAKRIADIEREGLSPIVRVIARGLTEEEALLVEKTLLWKLGKWTTNIATGHFADKFRPHNTLHRELSGFDYERGIYYYNVGEGPHRNWDDYVQFGFISAGQGRIWRDAMLGFSPGDAFFAYLKRHGFVGVGIIRTRAAMIRTVSLQGKPLLSLPLRCQNMNDHDDDPELSEYVCFVEWKNAVSRQQAIWRSSRKLFTARNVRASLDGKPETLEFLKRQFGINVRDLIT